MNAIPARPMLIDASAGRPPAEATAAAPKAEETKIVALKAPRNAYSTRILTMLGDIAVAVIPPLVVLAISLLVWQLATDKPDSALPSPLKIWSDANDLIVSPFFVYGPQDIGLGWRVLTLGAVVGQSVWAMRGLDPIFQVLRTVPPLAWLPISLAAFRDSGPSAVFVIFITAVWPVIINTAVGIRNIPQDYRNVAEVLRLNPLEYFWRIMIPSAAPYIFTGLRIGIGLSWLAIVAAEMLTGGVGIGFFIWDAWNSSRLSDIVVALVYIGIVGFVLDRLVALAGRIATRGTASS
jgi:nitrate/nitrite transport system permease protein